VRVVLDNDKVSFGEDEPLQMRLWSSSTVSGSSGPTSATVDVMATTKVTVDKEAMDKRVVEEAVVKEAADKEATDKRATEEAMVKEAVNKEATNKRAAEEAAVKEAVDKEAADKRTTEEAMTKEATDKDATNKRAVEEAMMKEAAVGVARSSSASGQVPSSVEGAKRAMTPSGSTPPAKRPYRGVWKPHFVQFSCTPLFHLVARFSSE
jgi:hypothetical protein